MNPLTQVVPEPTSAPVPPPPPQLPTLPGPEHSGVTDIPCSAARTLTVDTRTRVERHAATNGLAPDTTFLAAAVRVVAVWSRQPHFAIDVAVGNHIRTPVTLSVDPADSFAVGAHACEIALRGARQPGIPSERPATPVLVSIVDKADHDADPLPAGVSLHCVIATGRAEVTIAWHSAELYPAGMLDDLADAVTELLADLATTADAWHRTDRELLPQRQQDIRAAVNATTGPLPPVVLHELFWNQAGRTPDAPAVIFDGGTVTYRQLRSAATAIAHHLLDTGTRPGQLVAVVMDKGWEQAAAVLGILAAGAAYVPIMPDLPVERMHYLFAHAEVRTALTQPHLLGTLPWPAGLGPYAVTEAHTTPPTPDHVAAVVRARDGLPRWRQQPCDLAYVIYTSGSTGTPKGVMIDHRGAVNTILDINRRFHVGPTDRVLALSSLSFDLSVYDIFGLLAAGGAIVVPGRDSARAPWSWLDSIAAHQVTVWNTVPALMEMLATFTTARRTSIATSLRLVLMSGDWIPVTLPDRIRAIAAPGIELIGMGGATEASIWSNFYRIDSVDPGWPSIPYGRPLTNQTFDVLDAALRQQPAWVPGELHIGGAGVALGYWRDPVRTAASFIIHPYTGQRLYRTGDLGRYLPDGILEFLGREDFQVKIQGFRVELGEIEAAILAHPAVGSAAVCAVGERHADKYLAAYVVTAGDRETIDIVAAVRGHLTERLPGYLVPTRITVLDHLPLTANGKVDRTALTRESP